MYGYIYRIMDLTNGKCYIGQHKYDKPVLDPKYHGSSKIIKNQIKKHPKNFLEEILMICATLEEANYFETYFIEHMNTLYPNGYNLTEGGDNNPMNNPYVRAKHLESSKSPDRCKKISEALKGKPKSEKHKANMSGENNHNYKYKISEDEIYNLYVFQKKSLREIAKIYGCHKSVILRRMKKFNIERRESKVARGMQIKHCISKEQLYNLYVKDNLSASYIANLFECSLSCICKKLKKYNIEK